MRQPRPIRRRRQGAPDVEHTQRLLQWVTGGRGIDIAVVVLINALALAPLVHAYQSRSFYIAAGAGLIAGAVITALAAARRWPTLTVIAATLVTCFGLGGLAAPTTAIGGIIPTPQTWQLMGVGTVTVWKQVLTISPPLGGAGVLLMLPYLFALLGTVVAGTLALRTRRTWTALIPPVAVLIGSVLFGTRLAFGALLLGVGGVLIALMWVAWHAGRLEVQRVVALPVVAGLVVIGGIGGNLLFPADSVRYVLRDQVEPPPDPRDFSSPLAGFRKYVDDLDDDVLFTVDGDTGQLDGTLGEHPDGGMNLRLAAMHYYDGRVWNIATTASDATGAFARTGERITSDSVDEAPELTIQVGDYEDVWVPNAGGTVDVTFDGSRQKDLTRGFFYNSTSATGITTAGLQGGDEVGFHFTTTATLDHTDRARLQAESLALPEPVNVPDEVQGLAKDFSEGASGDYQRVEAMATSLSEYGYFSHGLEGEQQSRPGHGAARIETMIDDEDQIIGDGEQYAALLGLMVRSLGMPARVVMGFHVDPGEHEVTGDDVTAWVEVPFEDEGWLPFYPTPPEDQEPQAIEDDTQDLPVPQVIQPPDPPEPEVEVPPQERDEIDPDSKESTDDVELASWVRYSVVIGIPLFVLIAPFLIIIFLKARRRRRRRLRGTTSTRLAGGWQEVTDQAIDLGLAYPRGLTRRETSQELHSQAGVQMSTLATRADAAVFAPDEPAEKEVDAYWQQVHQARQRLRKSRSLRRRSAAVVSWASVRRHRRAGKRRRD